VGVIYVAHEKAGEQHLKITGELFKYLIKVRRHKEGDVLVLRSHENIALSCEYRVESIEPKTLYLSLVGVSEQKCEPTRGLHIGWCIVDTKSVEKILPMLNEIGVKKISFIYCERSQKNFKPDFKRFERILQSSSMQCGRTDAMEFETLKKIELFLEKYPQCAVFDFCDTVLRGDERFETILIGSEGGFSDLEKALLKTQNVYRLDTPMVLRAETAVVAVASKMLL
jgi:16S rRNA (uracil1498-N3)-methyltransferase